MNIGGYGSFGLPGAGLLAGNHMYGDDTISNDGRSVANSIMT